MCCQCEGLSHQSSPGVCPSLSSLSPGTSQPSADHLVTSSAGSSGAVLTAAVCPSPLPMSDVCVCVCVHVCCACVCVCVCVCVRWLRCK